MAIARTWGRPKDRLTAPVYFASLVMFAFALALLPFLLRHHFDVSAFIVAGDRFVAAPLTPSPIFIRPHSAGYDGQFYYAIATDPWSMSASIGGVALDHPAWRLQRILYPLIAHAIALGQPAFIPASLLATNLAGLFALAWLAARACQIPSRSAMPALAIMLWPGFLTSLTHDTTELLACALLLGALLAYLDSRYILFACVGALAALTRETCSLMLAGIALANIPAMVGAWCRAPSAKYRVTLRAARPAICAALALLPFLLWHLWLAHQWNNRGPSGPVQANIGLPFVGVLQRLVTALRGTVAFHGVATKARLINAYTAIVAMLIIGFSVRVAMVFGCRWRSGGNLAVIFAGWVCMVFLISLLSARGPWIDTTSIFRAYSECWVTGCLILARSGRPLHWSATIVLLPLALVNWSICLRDLG